MKLSIALLYSLIVLFIACKDPVEPDLTSNVFFNSFESQSDTVGWVRYGGMAFVAESPPNGGKQSVQVAGGCIVPHALFQFNGPPLGGRVVLQCWGKNLAIGGAVSLYRVGNDSKRIGISVQDTVWTFKQSNKVLQCQPGDRLAMEMNSGGFVASSMLIDLLEVKKVD